MGVDDEYKMVAAQDDANDHLLERSGPISRSSYRKRNMFASIAVGVVIGAAVMFLISYVFAPQGYTINKAQETTKEPAKVEAEKQEAPLTMTVTQTIAATATAPAFQPPGAQDGVDDLHRMPKDATILDCGHTVEEARAKDCVFDVMMQDWMPRPCFDEVLSERYLLNGNWTWWADAEASRAIPLEEMKKGEHPVIYVIQDYHKSHCIYAWEKATRAMRNDWPMIEEIVSYDHIMHCKHSTLSKESEGVGGVRAPTAWVRCALYKDWLGRMPANSISSIEKRDGAGAKRWEPVQIKAIA